ncbi:MAG TPA: XRE family transcriptional regulator, partial [Psychrobacter sp.]|nr:XRE family transcriptional regulator [Psychrobacter sp.]
LLKEQEVQKDSQIAQSAESLMSTIRKIESKQARQIMAVETQMMQIKQRLDKEDKHIMLSDLDCDYQYSLPLSEPVYSDEEMIKGVTDGKS